MKIGIDIRAVGRQRTGDETYTRELVKNLLTIDFENQYFLLTDTKNKKEIREIQQALQLNSTSAKAEIVSLPTPLKKLWTFRQLPRFLFSKELDILHVQYITPFAAPIGTKVVTTVHDVSFEKYPQLINKIDLLALKMVLPQSLKRVDKIIAVSRFTKQEILKYFLLPASKIEVIYNGGADKIFFQEDANKKAWQLLIRQYALTNNYLLYVGTLQPRKNIPFLLENFVRLKKKYAQDPKIKSLKLAISGKRNAHNYDKKIDKILKRLKKTNPAIVKDVLFLGFVDFHLLPVLMRQAKAVCLPSLYEGFGLPIIEAMAVGTPILASDISCHREIAGEAAIFFDPFNKDDFIQKARELLLNEKRTTILRERGKKRALDFSWKRCAQETLALYQILRQGVGR